MFQRRRNFFLNSLLPLRTSITERPNCASSTSLRDPERRPSTSTGVGQRPSCRKKAPEDLLRACVARHARHGGCRTACEKEAPAATWEPEPQGAPRPPRRRACRLGWPNKRRTRGRRPRRALPQTSSRRSNRRGVRTPLHTQAAWRTEGPLRSSKNRPFTSAGGVCTRRPACIPQPIA